MHMSAIRIVLFFVYNQLIIIRGKKKKKRKTFNINKKKNKNKPLSLTRWSEDSMNKKTNENEKTVFSKRRNGWISLSYSKDLLTDSPFGSDSFFFLGEAQCSKYTKHNIAFSVIFFPFRVISFFFFVSVSLSVSRFFFRLKFIILV